MIFEILKKLLLWMVLQEFITISSAILSWIRLEMSLPLKILVIFFQKTSDLSIEIHSVVHAVILQEITLLNLT